MNPILSHALAFALGILGGLGIAAAIFEALYHYMDKWNGK
jgi:hypothetical protein